MAPSLRKGKARAEAHKGRVITSKRKSHTRTCLSQQEVINKYLEDHPDFWEKEESCKGVHSLMPDLGRVLSDGGLAASSLRIPPEV